MKSSMKLLILVATMPLMVMGSCKNKEILKYNDNANAVCVSCPNNCAICYAGLNDIPICAFCDDGYFLKNNKCEKCADNCGHCIGPELSQCRTTLNGYFYDMANKKISLCKEGCASCQSAQVCSACSEGYYASERKNVEGEDQVTCSACSIDNCLFCQKAADQMKGQDFLTCNLCKTGYGLISGKCEKCPDNCQYCHEENRECTFCEQGYFLSPADNTCKPIDVPHCYSMTQEGKCSYCESHFFLNGQSCETCRSRIMNCSYCTGNSTSVDCLSCQIGHHKTAEGKCAPCGDNCNHCDASRCTVCANGFFYDSAESKCTKCPIANCEFCRDSEFCENCSVGYFFDQTQKKCVRCKSNCLRCSSDGDNCLSCPLDHFSLQEEVVTERKSNDFVSSILSMFIGFVPSGPKVHVTEIKTMTKCVKECPKTLHDKPVIINLAERRCHARFDKSASVGRLSAKIEKQDLLKSLLTLRLDYEAQISHTKKQAWESPSKDRHSECNYKGVLKKEIRGNLESYYICRCDPHFLGDNCQIPEELHNSMQTKLVDILNELESQIIGLSHRKKSIFLQVLVQVNKFKIGAPIIEKMISLVRSYLEKDKSLDNKKKLYILYDGLLLNLFDLLEEIRKLPIERQNTDADVFKQKNDIYSLIKVVLKMIESSLEDQVYANSFLERESSNYVALDTFSYILAENKISSYVEDKGFVLQNPNIDTSSKIQEPNRLYLEFEDSKTGKTSRFNIQMITFSSTLFQKDIHNHDDVILSNLFYIKLVDPSNSSLVVLNKDAGLKKLTIEFALMFIPSYEKVLDHVNCLAYDFFGKNESFEGKAVEFNDDTQTLKCVFYSYFEFRNLYFGVATKKL